MHPWKLPSRKIAEGDKALAFCAVQVFPGPQSSQRIGTKEVRAISSHTAEQLFTNRSLPDLHLRDAVADDPRIGESSFMILKRRAEHMSRSASI